MRFSIRALAALALFSSLGASAQDAPSIDGRFIEVTGTDVRSTYPILTLDWDGPASDELRYYAKQDGTGRDYPATLRDGEFTFVPRGMLPGETYRFRVSAEPKHADYAPIVRIEKRENEDALDVFIEDQLLTTYYYSNDNKKPFLWPINSMRGISVTRDWPMKDDGDPKGPGKDHPHHKSMWIAYGDINGEDMWDEGDKAGYQRSDEVTFGSGDAYGWIHAKNTWLGNDKQPVIAEEREYRFYATPERGRMIDQKVTLTASYGEAKFGDTKEGGLCAVRMRPELSGRNAHIVNAQGDEDEARAWGTPSPWCDYSGEIEGAGVLGLTIMDNPENFRFPSCWHVRSYGLMGANAFGYSYFRERKGNESLPETGDYVLKEGDALTMNYRVYVHAGDVEKADVKERYADYANPPKAVWLP